MWRGRFTALANPCEILCETEDAQVARDIVRCAASEAWRIEQKFSRYREGSVVHAINTSNGRDFTADEETARLIEFGVALWRLSDGAFDLTSGVLRKLWRFEPGAAVPEPERVQDILQHIGWHRVTWESPVLTMPSGMQLDFGGIGKEYAVDRAVAAIADTHASAVLVNFGGDLRCGGRVPRQGYWQVGIESSVKAMAAHKRIRLGAGALATSGDTRRFIEEAGQRYSHILDARTGWPVIGAPRSITVAARTCSQAGTLSTLAMMKGERAEAFLQAEGVRSWCLR